MATRTPRVSRWFAPLLLTGALAACASMSGMTRSAIEDAGAVAGVWRGWLITPRDSLPATLEIKDDGTFAISAPRVRVAGVLSTGSGVLRFEGTGAWHGVMTLYEHHGKRLFKLERDDRLFPGRFTPLANTASD